MDNQGITAFSKCFGDVGADAPLTAAGDKGDFWRCRGHILIPCG